MKTPTKAIFTAKTPRCQEPLFPAAFLAAWLLAGLFLAAACTSTKTDPDPKDDQPEENPDQEIITGELQSDFLELGKAAGVEWLSFYPDDFLEYPELFEGYDRDQRRHVRLAPRDGANKILLEFDLPAGAKIKPVDWYGTECVAIDLPEAKGFTVALGLEREGTKDAKMGLANARAARLSAEKPKEGVTRQKPTSELRESVAVVREVAGTKNLATYLRAAYGSRQLPLSTGGNMMVWIEWAGSALDEELVGHAKQGASCQKILDCISIVRELALEGSPKHQCLSSIEDLKAGIVAYEKGGLKLALPEGWVLRKTGSSSTVEIDGAGAKPLALIRKLKPYSNGNLRGRVNADTVFARRRDRTDAFFSAGRALGDAEPFTVAFDYKDGGVEQVGLCVIATGNEWLTVEIVSTGLREGEARRKAKEAVLNLLSKAKPVATPAGSASTLSDLVGWKPRE